jgi:tetratricopeptide (TPR) repeat protein
MHRTSTCFLILAVLSLLAPAAAAAEKENAKPIGLQLAWSSGSCQLEGVLSTVGNECLVISIACFGTTHHIVVDPADPWIHPGRPVEILDRYLRPDKEGKHEVTAMVRERESRAVLLRATATVEVSRTDEESVKDALNSARGYLVPRERSAWLYYGFVRQEMKLGSKVYGTPKVQDKAAEDYLNACHTDLENRVLAYRNLAQLYESLLRPGDGLRALEKAEEIQEQEGSRLVTGTHLGAWPVTRQYGYFTRAPVHLLALARHHGRSGKLEECLARLDKVVEWYQLELRRTDLSEKDKVDARDQLASTYREIAHVHVLLAWDWKAYDENMARCRANLSEHHSRVPIWGGGGVSTAK